MSTALLIANPQAGQHDPQLVAVQNVLRPNYKLATFLAPSSEEARNAAQEAASAGYRAVFALGGDGTARQVAAGLLGSDTEFGVLPGGTTNVVAKSLGLSPDPAAAAVELVTGSVIDADVGAADEEVFLMQASGGLDAEVVESVNPTAKKHLGRAAYAAPAMRCWWQYEYPEIEIRVDGNSRQIGFFAVCNIPQYAGRFEMAPGASFLSRGLNLVTLRSTGRWAALEFAVAFARGKHTDLEDVTTELVEEVIVDGPFDLRMQLDGDLHRPQYPVSIRLADERVRLRVPLQRSDQSETL